MLNNLEFDHADIFRDLADVQRTFTHLTRIVPRNGWIILNGDDDNLNAYHALSWTRVLKVGVGAGCDVRIENFREDASGVRFSISWKGERWGDVRWSLPGLYNVRNAAMAAVAAALSLDETNPRKLSLEPLARFRGVKRRQEILVDRPQLRVIEDFGHHPTALAEAIRSFRARFPGATLTAVFEPRSNTARTKTMQAGFSEALAQADEVYLGAVNRAEKLSASERFDTEGVAEFLSARGRVARTAATNAELLTRLQAETLQGTQPKPRVVVFFTNGSFDGIIANYADAARAAG